MRHGRQATATIGRGVVKRVLLAAPRGYCAGVERAIDTVEAALQHFGPPVYVRRQIVHNAHVVEAFEARGVVFVEHEHEVPEGETVIFSAHGVSPAVYAGAHARSSTPSALSSRKCTRRPDASPSSATRFS
jgi:4-hydroxy-3-methylbut-2-en-1-yl diphosphate reductase